MKRSHLLTAILVSAAALMTACQADLPIKEMAEAKSAITLAEKYQAATYAKEEFDAAAKSLLDSHEAVKNEKAEDAKKAALDSKAKADAALAKALRFLRRTRSARRPQRSPRRKICRQRSSRRRSTMRLTRS